MTPVQIRMARAALQLDVATLAERARVSVAALEGLEAGHGDAAAAAKLRASLEAEGIEFLGGDGLRLHGSGGPGELSVPIERLTTDNDE